jgi:hypothetical protein
LLTCGIVASLLYVATDVLGAARYDGYRFSSQGISELMAIGSPSKPLVDPLFMIYDLLMVTFGIGVFVAARRNRPLRATAVLLIAYAVAGLPGPLLFPMHRRGAGSMANDAPHLVLTGVLVLLMLLAIGFGAFALGMRFRVYSFATLMVLMVLGAVTGAYGPRFAAEQPTPGFGIVERVLIGAFLLWVLVLAIALLPPAGGPRRAT